MAPALRLPAWLLVPHLLTSALAPLAAQDRAVTQLQVRVWNADDGVPVNMITALHQAADGYVWIGTESGLVRFDGERFTADDDPESPLYSSSHITALAVGPGGDLWIGTSTGLIRRTGSRSIRWEGEPRELATAYVEDLHVDDEGQLWVGTNGAGLFLISDDTVGRPVTIRGFEPRWIRDIARSGSGLPWVATDEGLARLAADTTLVRVTGGETPPDVRAVVEDARGRVWLGTREGLYLLEGDRPVPAREAGPLASTMVRALLEDRNGHLWAATSGHGLMRLAGERWERLGPEHGLPSDDLHALARDDRGDLWVGTGGGVALVYQGDVLPITPSEGLSSPVVLPVLKDRAGVLWVGTFGGGLNRIDGAEVRVIGPDDGLPHAVVLSLAEDRARRIWIGTRSGLRIYDGGRLIESPAPELSTVTITSLLAGRDGRMWVGTTQSVLVVDGAGSVTYGPAQGLENPWVISLHEGRDGSILVGTQSGGAYRISGRTVESLTVPGGPQTGAVFTFHESDDGTLWIGSDAGLLRIREDGQVLIGRSHGVPDRSTARILSDGRGYFWVGTNRGVYRVSQVQLDSVADGTRASIAPRVFTARDGMPSSETNGGFHPAGWRGEDGRLFFPTMEGVAVFDPASEAIRTSPLRVVVEGIETGAAGVQQPRGTDLPPEVDDLSISYTALDFRHGDQAEFRYRLVGYDTAWIAAGQRRTAYYTHVPPGWYTFMVQARLPGEAWAPADPLPFRLRPYLYETLWFRVAAVLLAALLVLALHRWRVRTLRRRERELLGLISAREAAEQRYREIFANAREVVISLDADGRIVEANLEASRVLGCDTEALVGRSLESFAVADGDGERDPGKLARIAADEGLIELEMLRDDRSRVRVEASIRELKEDGRTRGFQVIGRDITDRRMLEDRLRQSQRMEAVGLLAGGVAHDFNNILSVISGYTTLLLKGMQKSDPLRDDAREIAEAADRAAALTHQLLAFSRKQTLRPQVLQLNHVVVGLEKLLRRLIDEDIEFVVDLAPDLWPVTADPGQMEQVITNLAVNARDAMPTGGHLTIRTRNQTVEQESTRNGGRVAPGDYVVVTVMDTGVGMTPEVRDRIFDPFFTTKATGYGTGLGLATVHGIVEQSGGFVQVSSAPGEGSTFDVYLPREREAPQPVREAVVEPESEKGHETILVVDDESSIRRLVRRVLENAGYRVLDAPSPLAALEVVLPAHGDEIALLLSDVVMPQMSGPDLADRMTDSLPGLKTIFMSGYAEEKLASRVITHRLLRKPFGPAELLRTVREALDE